MLNDPNWLFSTIAQSSAAIVAIIGGFITASVLMLMGEKRSLTHQKADKETQLNTRNEERNQLTDLYETMRVESFFSSISYELSEEDILPPLDELMQRHQEWKLDPEILKREYEKLSKHRLEARKFIEQNSDATHLAMFSSFDKWVKENKFDISHYDYEILEEEFNRFREREKERLEEEKRRAEEERKKNLPSYLRGIVEMQEKLGASMNFAPFLPALSGVTLHQLKREDNRFENVRNRIEMLGYEIQLLDNEVNSLNDRIKAFSYPPNLGWGVAVLGFLAFFGILIPTLIMANEAFFSWTKLLTLITFWLGLVGVFTYVVFQIRTLKK